MSRTGARDRARRQLTETLTLLTQAVSLLCKSRVVLKRSRSADAAECLAMIESFCSCPLPTHPEQHPDNLAVDQFATAMKTKLAEGRTKGLDNWNKPWVKDEQLAELFVKNISKGNPGNFVDIANFAMMLHQRGADPLELTLADNKSHVEPYFKPPKDGIKLATPSAKAKANDARYRYMRERNVNAISKGSVLTGKTPDNVVVNLDDLDGAFDIALAEAVKQ
ncbi:MULTISPECIES: hypothetical protein [Pseudomonas syringae group]|uniref:Uncharacterized protein n=1 Tax=Pseudomonas syringae pv. ribicola TaxID=55398 RepID=A0A3M2W3L4_PSESI|nr:hypothetical protein [Pseudomonas syringae group genomosp. 3]RML45993.1 hypothetical protein ALQ95_02309 [Pseudomonas syringae pv. ribicola]